MTEAEQTITFTVPGTPKPQGSMKCFGSVIIHNDSPALKNWRELVGFYAIQAGRRSGWKLPVDQPIALSARFVLPKPKKPRWWLPAVKPDLDKLLRAVGDALSPKKGMKFLAEDSRIVAFRNVEKVYADTPKETGAVIRVRLLQNK